MLLVSATAQLRAHNSGLRTHDSGYLRHIPYPAYPRYISCMSTGTVKFRCAQCERSEDDCECEKYCCLCQSVVDIRICTDGLMYCEPCREACDYKTSD